MKKALTTKELRHQKVGRSDFKIKQRNKVTLFLDRLQNNHNLGAILRLADAALVEEVLIFGENTNLKGKKTLRAARGVIKWVPQRVVHDDVEEIMTLKARGYVVISVELCGDSVLYYESGLTDKVCLIVGNETEGVSERLLFLSDLRVHIPMAGMANSLNVATATGIVLFDLIRRRSLA